MIYYLGYFFNSSLGVSAGLTLFVSYYLFNDSMFSLVVAALSVAPGLVMALLVPRVIRRIDKMKLFRICCLLNLVLGIVIWAAGYRNLWLFIGLSLIRAVPAAVVSVLLFLFTPDCAEYGRFKTGIDAKGITFAIQTFIVKLTAAVSGALGLFLLGLKSTGWVSVSVENFKQLQESGVVQSARALDVLWFIYMLVPVFGNAAAFVVWRFYDLKDKDVQIMADCNAGKLPRADAETALSKKYR